MNGVNGVTGGVKVEAEAEAEADDIFLCRMRFVAGFVGFANRLTSGRLRRATRKRGVRYIYAGSAKWESN